MQLPAAAEQDGQGTWGRRLSCSTGVVQFEMECRPFYVSGFNAHDLVPKSLATPTEHKTVGQSCRALIWTFPEEQYLIAGQSSLQLVFSLPLHAALSVCIAACFAAAATLA